jgi:FlaA1/EpsC-like NDP-sugar epimerase
MTDFASKQASRMVVQRLRELPMAAKTGIAVIVDLTMLVGLVLLAIALRYSALQLPDPSVMPLYLTAPVLSVICLALAGIYQAAVRSYTQTIELRLVMSQLMVPLIWSFILIFFGTNGFARSIVVIYCALSILGLVLLRRTASWLLNDQQLYVARRERVPVVIFGAGREGTALAESLAAQGRYQPMAFLETDYTLFGRRVNGLPVYAVEDLDFALFNHEPREALIAKPGLVRQFRRDLVSQLLARDLRVNIVPDIEDVVAGKINVGHVQPVKLEDLLGRDPVPPDQQLMERAVKARRVIVTGAGGSIGSEIVRQLISYQPASLVLYDASEFALFQIHREIEKKLAEAHSSCKLVPVLADILDREALSKTMQDESIEVVFHAAAYKHVRMVQENAAAGIRTNVFGTRNVVEESISSGVKLFVLISTDKAVRPTSVMGATKRLSEMVVQAAAKGKTGTTTFAIVRFGNVLGSSGSVIPIFQEQIAQGGPISVTHRDATRYFMLIPEAAQLVIQASALAANGEIFVLDMGESVNIFNLAKSMIELAGLSVKTDANPAGDVEIRITGLREGEKLHEELQIGRNISPTQHPRIMKSDEIFLPRMELERALKKLQSQMANRSDAIGLVMEIANRNAWF